MNVRKTAKGALGIGKATLLGTANAVHGMTEFVGRHEDQISAITRGSITVAAKVATGSGAAVAAAGNLIQRTAHRRADGATNTTFRVVGHGIGYVGGALCLLGRGVQKAGELTGKGAPVVGGIVGGAVSGGTAVASDALDSIAITKADIDKLRRELSTYGERLRKRSDARLAAIQAAQRHENKADLLDTLVVGGMTLSEILHSPGKIPHDIALAFKLQYPDLAKPETFADAIRHASPDQLVGLTSGVKGKLFELTLIDHLNSGGNLPPGFHAELAHGATQPGWDLKVLDPHGHVVDLIQAKATDSVEYVRQALERYPDIDVTTTHDVYAHLAALGMAQHVTDSGVPLAALNADVAHAVANVSDQFHGISFVPSTLSLAIIGLSVLMDKHETWAMAGRQFGKRTGKAGVAVGTAKAALVVTQTWWMGLLAGVGSRLLAAYGGRKRERYQQVVEALATLRPLMASPVMAR